MPDAISFPRPLTPGAYLKARRCAAGLSVHDLAGKLPTQPRIAEHLRAEWIERIEADVDPVSFATIAALRWAYEFDMRVLETLALIALGADLLPPRLCRICACSEHDPCTDYVSGATCSWTALDQCSACAGPAAAEAIAA